MKIPMRGRHKGLLVLDQEHERVAFICALALSDPTATHVERRGALIVLQYLRRKALRKT